MTEIWILKTAFSDIALNFGYYWSLPKDTSWPFVFVKSSVVNVGFAVSDGMIGVGLAAGAAALLASGIAAAVAGSRSQKK